MNGNVAATNVETFDIGKKKESPSVGRQKLSLELRRTAGLLNIIIRRKLQMNQRHLSC